MKQPLGVILAGGRATRMGGGDKGLLPLGRGTVLSHVIARIAPQVRALAINANGDPARFAAFGLPVLPDPIPGHQGPLAGVLAGLDWAADQQADSIVTVAADTPFFPCDLVPRLLLAAEGGPASLAIATTPPTADDPEKSVRGGMVHHATFGLWPVALREDLRRDLHNGQRKTILWAEQHGSQQAVFPPDKVSFFNINTPEDLICAQACPSDR